MAVEVRVNLETKVVEINKMWNIVSGNPFQMWTTADNEEDLLFSSGADRVYAHKRMYKKIL